MLRMVDGFDDSQICDRLAQDWWLFASQVDKLKYFLRSFVCCTTEPFDGKLKMFIFVELGEFFVLNVLIILQYRKTFANVGRRKLDFSKNFDAVSPLLVSLRNDIFLIHVSGLFSKMNCESVAN